MTKSYVIRKVKRAFTITELVIVIAVIGILAAVLVPSLSYVVSNSRKSSDEAYVSEMSESLSSYVNTYLGGVVPSDYKGVMSALKTSGYCTTNAYLLASNLQCDGGSILWYPATCTLVLVYESDGYTLTPVEDASIAAAFGNAVKVEGEGTITYAVRLCTNGSDAEIAAAELYSLYYSAADVSTFVASTEYAAALQTLSALSPSWATAIDTAVNATL